MVVVTIECDRCGKRIEKKYSWLRAFSSNDLKNFYAAQGGGFSDDFMDMDLCPDCKDKVEEFTFRE
jgi:uncharacterized protein YlaI